MKNPYVSRKSMQWRGLEINRVPLSKCPICFYFIKVHKTEPNEVQQLDLIFKDRHFLDRLRLTKPLESTFKRK